MAKFIKYFLIVIVSVGCGYFWHYHATKPLIEELKTKNAELKQLNRKLCGENVAYKMIKKTLK